MVSLIVAIGPNRVIGKNNYLPWHIKEDLMHFKNYTRNKTILFGKNTFVGMGCRILPERKTIIVCNDDDSFSPEGVIVEKDLFEVINRYKNTEEELVVCGGAGIYKASLPLVDKMVVSYVKKEYDGDTFFPPFEDNFVVVSEEDHEEFVVKVYRRK